MAYSKQQLDLLAEYEADYGDSSDWGDALFERNFYDSFRAGHCYAMTDKGRDLLQRLHAVILNEKDFDKVFTSNAYGIPHVYDDRKTFLLGMKKDYREETQLYFTDAFPDGGFDLSAYGFFPIDMKILEKNLEKFTPSAPRGFDPKNPHNKKVEFQDTKAPYLKLVKSKYNIQTDG